MPTSWLRELLFLGLGLREPFLRSLEVMYLRSLKLVRDIYFSCINSKSSYTTFYFYGFLGTGLRFKLRLPTDWYSNYKSALF